MVGYFKYIIKYMYTFNLYVETGKVTLLVWNCDSKY